MNKIKVVDIFAGPGGLGEGFARFSPRGAKGSHPYHIVLSAEKDPAAVRTLSLRTFYRRCTENGGIPESYYDYLRDPAYLPYDSRTKGLWQEAMNESRPLTLGTSEGGQRLREALRAKLDPRDDWILIGGPPCQAYSLVGRSRNKGIRNYRPESDERHYLYRHYLDLLAEFRPAAFVMENVKGILSSRIGNNLVFPQILRDLSTPNATGNSRSRVRYRIHSLVTDETFCPGQDPDGLDSKSFIVRSEDYGIPQARHRVILVGIREDLCRYQNMGLLRPATESSPVEWALRSLPPLRSGLSKGDMDAEAWHAAIEDSLRKAIRAGLGARDASLMRATLRASRSRGKDWERGGRFVDIRRPAKGRADGEKKFLRQIQSEHLGGIPNHETRGHLPMDLVRYLFASTFAAERGRSPLSHEFPDALAPAHKNWGTGNFADRFRVQHYGLPSMTVTSHISKDGHYYIHPDPEQCRSLTVREAARLQTFPDDYFFEGNRTEQYVQVGNAVPPILAEKIAALLYRTIYGSR